MKTQNEIPIEATHDIAQQVRRRKRRRLSSAPRNTHEFASTPRTITDYEGALWRVVEDCDAQKLVHELNKLGDMI